MIGTHLSPAAAETHTRPTGERDVTYGYDLRGLQTSATFTGTSDAVTNAYDGFGRMVSSAVAMGGTTRTLSYRHDADGNRTRITYPDGNWWQQDYDGLNRPTWLSYAGSYGQQYLNYNADGTAQAANKANGTSVAFTYDGVQRLAGFSLDAAGMTNDSGWSFGRNPASQLVSLARSNDLYAYALANASTAYAIDGLNRATQVAGSAVTYDGNGNLTGDPGAMSGGASATTFAYDSENRLVSASGAHNAALAYDPLDRLTSLTSGGTTTTFLYDGDALVAEYNGSTLLRRHIHWPGADVPVVTWEGAGLTDPRYLHADERGSIVAITDQSGAATLNRYDEYGVPGATNAGRFQYTGQLWLPELGLYYYKARMYSPYGGRFMQADPIGYQGGINIYGYVSDDPIDRSDPSGLRTDEYDACGSRIRGANRCIGTHEMGPGDLDLVGMATGAGQRSASSGRQPVLSQETLSVLRSPVVQRQAWAAWQQGGGDGPTERKREFGFWIVKEGRRVSVGGLIGGFGPFIARTSIEDGRPRGAHIFFHVHPFRSHEINGVEGIGISDLDMRLGANIHALIISMARSEPYTGHGWFFDEDGYGLENSRP